MTTKTKTAAAKTPVTKTPATKTPAMAKASGKDATKSKGAAGATPAAAKGGAKGGAAGGAAKSTAAKSAAPKAAAAKPAKAPAAAKPKAPRAAPKPGAKPNALQTPLTPSADLAAIVGAGQMARGQVVSKVWEYIKANNLQDAKDKRQINADAKLQKIFGGKSASMFEMNKHIAKHLK